jgi:hypothetical protein
VTLDATTDSSPGAPPTARLALPQSEMWPMVAGLPVGVPPPSQPRLSMDREDVRKQDWINGIDGGGSHA